MSDSYGLFFPALLAGTIFVACSDGASNPTTAASSAAVTRAASTVGAGGSGAAGGGDLGGAGGEGAGWPEPPPDYCNLCQLTDTFPIATPLLIELSGLAASADHSGAFYAHNDSGDTARFFALDSMGADLGVYTLEAVVAQDFEDIARGPCGAGSCLFIADVGDNDLQRFVYQIYRVPEPDMLAPGTYSALPSQLKLEYPNGSRNAEALIVHPQTGEIWLLPNEPGTSNTGIYHAPGGLQPNVLTTLTKLGEFATPQGIPFVSGADLHPMGYGVLVRTFSHLFYYARSGPEEPLEETFQRAPCVMPVANEDQGEAVAWTAAGDGYVTASEGPGNVLHHAACTTQ
jgi:hypothetical protein